MAPSVMTSRCRPWPFGGRTHGRSFFSGHESEHGSVAPVSSIAHGQQRQPPVNNPDKEATIAAAVASMAGTQSSAGPSP